MSKAKARIITAIMAGMLALLLVWAHRLDYKTWLVMLALLACYGYLRGAGDLCRWMQSKEQPIPIIEAEEVKTEDDPFAHDDEFAEGSARFDFGTVRFREGVFSETEGKADE